MLRQPYSQASRPPSAAVSQVMVTTVAWPGGPDEDSRRVPNRFEDRTLRYDTKTVGSGHLSPQPSSRYSKVQREHSFMTKVKSTHFPLLNLFG